MNRWLDIVAYHPADSDLNGWCQFMRDQWVKEALKSRKPISHDPDDLSIEIDRHRPAGEGLLRVYPDGCTSEHGRGMIAVVHSDVGDTAHVAWKVAMIIRKDIQTLLGTSQP